METKDGKQNTQWLEKKVRDLLDLERIGTDPATIRSEFLVLVKDVVTMVETGTLEEDAALSALIDTNSIRTLDQFEDIENLRECFEEVSAAKLRFQHGDVHQKEMDLLWEQFFRCAKTIKS